MKKRIFALVLAVVMVASASMAIYAGVNGFGGEYIAAEATLDCCAPEFTPDACPYNTVNGNGGNVGNPTPVPCCWNPCSLWCIIRQGIGLWCNC